VKECKKSRRENRSFPEPDACGQGEKGIAKTEELLKQADHQKGQGVTTTAYPDIGIV